MNIRLETMVENLVSQNSEKRILWWNGRWWNRKEFLAKVAACREILEKSGFEEGDRLALYLPDSPLLLILSVAVWQIGGTIVPLNTRGGTEANLRILRKLKPSGIIFSEGTRGLPEAIESEGFTSVMADLEGPIPSFRITVHAEGRRDMAIIFATSGTTGNPKLVPLSHSNLLNNARSVHENVEGFETGNILMNILPNFHAFGFTVCGLLPLIFGLPQVLLPSFIPVKNTFAALREAEVRILIAVPTMLPFLLGAVEKGEKIPKSLRYILSGGGRLDPDLERRVEARMGVVSFQGYGLTECSPVVATNRSSATKKTGTIGLTLPDYEIEIRDPEGNVLPRGKEGILWVRGPSVCEGYLGAPELNEERFHNGWFNTGDIVSIDEDNYIKVLDRATDLIIVGGFNVYPQEIEEVIQEHPDVYMAAVVGIKHHLTGEYPKAFVIPQEGAHLTQTGIIQFCKDRLAHYKVPRKVEFVTELPLSPVGKILRRELRERHTS